MNVMHTLRDYEKSGKRRATNNVWDFKTYIKDLSKDYDVIKRLGDYGYYPYDHVTLESACGFGECKSPVNEQKESEDIWKKYLKPSSKPRFTKNEMKRSEKWFAKMSHCSLLNFKTAYNYVEPKRYPKKEGQWSSIGARKRKRALALKYPMYKALYKSMKDMIDGDYHGPAMICEPGIEQSLFDMYRTLWQCKILETEPHRFAKIEVALLKGVLEKHCTSNIAVHAVNGETRVANRPKPIRYDVDSDAFHAWPWLSWTFSPEKKDLTDYDVEDEVPLMIDEKKEHLTLDMPSRENYTAGLSTPTVEKSALFD